MVGDCDQAVYTLVATDPAQAVELLALVFAYPNTALDWVRQWPLFGRLQTQLQEVMGSDSYEMYWEKGTALTFAGIKTYLQQDLGAAFRCKRCGIAPTPPDNP